MIEEFARQGVEVVFSTAPERNCRGRAAPAVPGNDRRVRARSDPRTQPPRQAPCRPSGLDQRARRSALRLSLCHARLSGDGVARFEVVEAEAQDRAGDLRLDRPGAGQHARGFRRLVESRLSPPRNRSPAGMRPPSGRCSATRPNRARPLRARRALRIPAQPRAAPGSRGILAGATAPTRDPALGASGSRSRCPPSFSGTSSRAQELLRQTKCWARRRTKDPSIVQGLVSCRKCGYALLARLDSFERTQDPLLSLHRLGCVAASRTVRSARTDPCGRNLRSGIRSSGPRSFGGRGSTLIQQELDRRLDCRVRADPTKQRERGWSGSSYASARAIERLLTAYQEELLSLEQLRERMPELRQREQALRAGTAVDR